MDHALLSYSEVISSFVYVYGLKHFEDWLIFVKIMYKSMVPISQKAFSIFYKGQSVLLK